MLKVTLISVVHWLFFLQNYKEIYCLIYGKMAKNFRTGTFSLLLKWRSWANTFTWVFSFPQASVLIINDWMSSAVWQSIAVQFPLSFQTNSSKKQYALINLYNTTLLKTSTHTWNSLTSLTLKHHIKNKKKEQMRQMLVKLALLSWKDS